MEEWLAVGPTKRIDVSSLDADIFTKLRALLVREQSEREAQAAYLQRAVAAELESEAGRARARAGWLESQIAALQHEHAEFDGQLSNVLTRHLKIELEIGTAHVVALEREAGGVKSRLLRFDREHDAVNDRRLAALNALVSPLLQQAAALDGELANRLGSLPADHPSCQLARQRNLQATANETARVAREEADQLAVSLRAEKAAHAVTSSQFDAQMGALKGAAAEFSLKEQFQLEMKQLQEGSERLEREHAEHVAVHEAALGQLEAANGDLLSELTDLRKQRQTMALSLAQYAALETEWGEKTLARSTMIARLEKANRKLRKHAKRAAALEEIVAESSHDDVVRLGDEIEHLRARVELAESSLAPAREARDEMEAQIEDMKNGNSVSQWMAAERYAEREAQLVAQSNKAKQVLGRRVVRQWMLRTVSRCVKAWTTFVMTRKLRRELGAPESDDEHERLPAGAAGAQQRIDEVFSSLSLLTSQMTSQVHGQVTLAGKSFLQPFEKV